ncbi:MAG: hypothetical protein AB8G17_17270 [Gammaproteobacteria bacterium]
MSRFTAFVCTVALACALIVAVMSARLPNRTVVNTGTATLAIGGEQGVAPRGATLRSPFDIPVRATSGKSSEGERRCNEICARNLDALRSLAPLDDADYVRVRADIARMAEYLHTDAKARRELVALAVHADDGNKRRLVRLMFSELAVEHRYALGDALLQSPDAMRRREGVNFLAAEETLDDETAGQFLELLAMERDTRTKIALVKGLGQSNRFRGNVSVVEGLSDAIRTEMDAQLRGQALAASARLVESPDDLFFTIRTAIDGGDEEYGLYGLQALDTLLRRHGAQDGPLRWRTLQQARATLEVLLDQDSNSVSAKIIREASFVYARYF